MNRLKNAMINSKKSHCALILPGAVAKGAFEAGVVQVLAESDTRIDRIVATSSGALNGVAYAAGIRAGHERKMADRLVNAWIEGGGWANSLSPNPWGFIRGRGVSGPDGLLKMMRDLIQPCTHSAKRDVELRIIVTPLNGIQGAIGDRPATTYEKFVHFENEDFDTTEGLERIFKVTTAACAFPGLYAPVEIEGLGPCVDGGSVNNAPIKYALDEGDVGQIIMPVPFPSVMPANPKIGGFNLANHLLDILINERLYRDLKDAEMVNEEVRKIEALVESGVLNDKQFAAIKALLEVRYVKITEVRPLHSLKGNPFSGFFSKSVRKRLVEGGRKAALRILSENTLQTSVPLTERKRPRKELTSHE